MMTRLDAGSFETHRMVVRDDVELAYVHEGVGGVPLVLVHGWPSTKRLFWRNVAPLAAVGFEVIVPDQRGFGESPKPSSYVDVAASSRDVHALVTGLGHEWVIAAGGDWGSGVVQDMSHRFPGFVRRQAVWNGVAPNVPEIYRAAGLPENLLEEVARLWPDFVEHGLRPDEVMAKHDTPAKRGAYIREWYSASGARVWKDGDPPIRLAAAGSFDDEARAFMTEPFEDEDTFRASLGFYTAALGFVDADAGEVEAPLLDGPATVETMVLYGDQDDLLGAVNYPQRMEMACEKLVGPFAVLGSGHFVSFEKPKILNSALITFCRDLLPPSDRR
jgi:pimeloyl-ACP methyl ester carboxylesterase